MAERDLIGAIQAEPDAARKLVRYAEHLAAGSERHVPLQLVARSAAAVDGAGAQVWAQMRQEMLTGMTMFAADLMATGQVRPELTADEVRDLLWTYPSAEIYELLVLERGWTVQRYGRFLAEAMVRAVVADRAAAPIRCGPMSSGRPAGLHGHGGSSVRRRHPARRRSIGQRSGTGDRRRRILRSRVLRLAGCRTGVGLHGPHLRPPGPR
ncbi:hypothetical protein ACFPFQ_04035 [Pseudonocardia sp. GCM10023141]